MCVPNLVAPHHKQVLAFVAGGAFMIYWVKFRRPSVNVPADPALGSANQYNLL